MTIDNLGLSPFTGMRDRLELRDVTVLRDLLLGQHILRNGVRCGGA